ncbi:MAG: Gfo/Idh/MocA family oxidoreductase [Candidatus Sumerlaeota bacterium]|nr:Gfo/Idh/MocA family oxidoreductase [Candidatus Sumerlaeota bacterium]
MSKNLSRRDLLQVGAAAALAAVPGASLLAQQPRGAKPAAAENKAPAIISGTGANSPGNKLRIACIGCGGKGGSDVDGCSKTENIVALCDVDDKKAEGAFKKHPNVPKFKDFRKMFDKMANQIDAVTVSTPDHMHFLAAMYAMAHGKHVYVQKPMAHTVWEAREMIAMANKMKVATQMGNQGHSGDGTRLVVEWLRAGVIGDVKEIHYYTNRPVWPQQLPRPKEVMPVPAGMDWDLWLGGAPARPYNKAYAPFAWRGWWDFGCGALGDIACHSMDCGFWALNFDYPTKIEVELPPDYLKDPAIYTETAPNWSTIVYHFPARGKRPPVKVKWYDGFKDKEKKIPNEPPRPEGLHPEKKPLNQFYQFFYGEKGLLYVEDAYGNGPRLYPQEFMDQVKPQTNVPKTLERVPNGNHYYDWIQAIKTGGKAGSNFDYSGLLTEMVLLGNLAIRTGKSVEWDPKAMKVTNVPEANAFVKQEFRKGWEVPSSKA